MAKEVTLLQQQLKESEDLCQRSAEESKNAKEAKDKFHQEAKEARTQANINKKKYDELVRSRDFTYLDYGYRGYLYQRVVDINHNTRIFNIESHYSQSGRFYC